MRKIILILLVVVALLGVGAAGLVFWLLQPVRSVVTPATPFLVSRGQSTATIAKRLTQAGLVKSDYPIYFLLRYSQVVVQSGSYDLSPSMSIFEIKDQFAKGSKDTWVTLLEGWRSEEMADELAATLGTKYFNKSDFVDLAKNQEGHLFPDTYLFPKQATAGGILDTLSRTFNKKYTQTLKENGQSLLPDDQTVVLASIIERESREPGDMKIVSGILMNRLRAGMPLQVDATLQYATGYDAQLKTWWSEPHASDKTIESPFNTYANKGLPPAPICNPGLNALVAAIDPDKTDYYFYISDRQGNMHYARTLEEHDANIQKYLK